VTKRRHDHLDQDLLKPKEAADIFGVTAKTLANWADAGALPCIVTPGGERRYRRADVWALFRKKNPEQEQLEQDAVRLYLEGWGVPTVAEKFGCDEEDMRRILMKRTRLGAKTCSVARGQVSA
jgi:DNA-binding transcriptional MerR regulator